MFGRRIRWIVFGAIAVAVIAVAVATTWPELVPQNLQSFVQPMTTFVIAIASLAVILQLSYGWLFSRIGSARSETNREALIRIVRKNWIDGDIEHPGVLQDALRDAQFDIDLKTSPEKAGQSHGYEANTLVKPAAIIRRGKLDPLPIDTTPDALAKAFYDNDKQLLVLGAPGSGKTVLLLQLAQRLLGDAAADKMKAVPVVINLSSWAIKRQPIDEWMVVELQRGTYGVSKKQAQDWIKTDALIYLLDGLDEVTAERRADCLAALNAFITPERQVVVCSRSEEYDALATQFNAHNAIEVQPLQPGQFETYLREFIPYQETVDSLLRALQADSVVWAEVQKPLFANILISTYRDGKPIAIPSVEDNALVRIRQYVIEPYVTRQLQNALGAPYSNADTRKYLSWLGWQMGKYHLIVFYIEEIQRKWLSTSDGATLYKSLIFLFGTLFSIARLLLSGIRSLLALIIVGIFSGLLAGLFISITDNMDTRVRPTMNVSKLRSAFTEDQWSKPSRIARIILGVLFALPCALILRQTLVGTIIGIIAGVLFSEFVLIRIIQISARLYVGTLAMLFESWTIRESSLPNEGLRHALGSGILAPIIMYLYYLVVIAIFEIIREILGGSRFTLDIQILVPIVVWTISLLYGLGNVLNHVALRIVLLSKGNAPLRFDQLLYYVRDRRLMRQVGGGFIFIHRYVLEYFAAYWEEHYQKK